jgi:phage/plasmid-associated DNA primase
LNWAIAGLRDYEQNGMVEPQVVKDSTKEYMKSLDLIAQFIEEAGLLGQREMASSWLYQQYVDWSKGRNQFPVGIKRFGSDLEAHGFQKVLNRRGTFWRGPEA